MVPTLEIYKKLADGMGISVHHLFELLDDDAPVDLAGSASALSSDYPLEDIPHTPEARILAKGIDQMPAAQREAIINMMKGLYPGLFEKGDE